MAFPVIAAIRPGHSTSASVTHDILLPSGTVAGSQLLLMIAERDLPQVIVAVEHIATSDEVSDGNFEYTATSSTYCAWVCIRITGGALIEVEGALNDTSDVPNAGVMGSSWGSDDNLWLSIAGWEGDVSLSFYSSGYDDNQTTERFADATNGVGVAFSSQNIVSGSQDPGNLTLSGSASWGATCVVIQPAPVTSGTISATDGPDSSSISGVLSIPGTISTTDGPDTSNISGTHLETVTGTIANTDGPDTANITGTVTQASITGTISNTDGPDTSNITGVETIPGTISNTDGPDSSAISGLVTQSITGTIANTDGPDTSAISGVLTISGTIANTDGPDTSSITGLHHEGITGTISNTDGPDTSSIAGLITITGTIASTDGADTSNISGLHHQGITGTINVTDGPDVSNIVGFTPKRGGSKYCCCPEKCLIGSDDFNRSDSDSLGSKWVEKTGDWDISSNTLVSPTDGVVLTSFRQGRPRGVTYNYLFSVDLLDDTGPWGVICKYTDANNYDWVELTQSGTEIHPVFWRRTGGSDSLVMDATTHPAGVPFPVLGNGSTTLRFCYSEAGWSILGPSVNTEDTWTTCNATVATSLPSDTTVGFVGFTKGSFDNFAYYYHHLSNFPCDPCDCFCENPGDAADFKCIPETLTLTLRPTQIFAQCGSSPPDIVLTLRQSHPTLPGTPPPSYVKSPAKFAWYSDVVDAVDWFTYVWFRLECHENGQFKLFHAKYPPGDYYIDEDDGVLQWLETDTLWQLNDSISCLPIILHFQTLSVTFHETVPGSMVYLCEPFFAQEYEAIVTE